jgi:amino acid transporter
MLSLEVLVVVLFDIAIAGDPGPQGLTTIGFSPAVAFSTAVGATLTFCVASFVGFESAAIYSEECRDPRRTVARATYLAVGLIAVFYAISSWLLGVAAGPNTIVDPNALLKAGFHNAVARYAFALGREGVLPSVFGRVNRRTGSPWVASMTQSVLALGVVLVFAIAAANPVLTLFTWLTNLGALGVLLLMAATSFAVVGYFRRRPQDAVGGWAATWAPAIAGALLLVLLVLGVANFNVLITSSTTGPIDTMAIVLPALLLVALLVGMAVAARLRAADPQRYATIGERTAVEQVEHVT